MAAALRLGVCVCGLSSLKTVPFLAVLQEATAGSNRQKKKKQRKEEAEAAAGAAPPSGGGGAVKRKRPAAEEAEAPTPASASTELSSLVRR